MAKMSDTEIVSAVHRMRSSAVQYADSNLSKERRDAWKYLRGELPKVVSGRSSYVSPDVYDSVDAMRAQLLEAFSAHSRIAQFVPMGKTDIAQAEQATDFVSWVFFRQNRGLRIMYDVVTDSLLSRYGAVKTFVEVEEGEERDFEDLHPEELGLLLEDGFEPAGGDLVQGEDGTLTGRVKRPGKKCIKVAAIPLEELHISPGGTTMEDTDILHTTSVSKGWLLRQGYPKSKINKLTEGPDYQRDVEKRDRLGTDLAMGLTSSDHEPSRSMIELHDAYVTMDIEGRGRDCLYWVRIAGDVLLEYERIKRKPITIYTPLPVPHSPFGENFAKFVFPIQNARTVLMRGVIDHTVLTTNPRLMVVNGTLSKPNELMDNRLGGLVNVRRADGIVPLPQAPMNPFVFNALSQLDTEKESTTGISKLSQGLSKDALSKQNAASSLEAMVTLSQTRQKVAARQFGEFVRELWLTIYDTALTELDQEVMLDVCGEWTPVDPTKFLERTAVTVELALSQSEAAMESQKLLAIDAYLGSDPRFAQQYTPVQRYNLISRILKRQGISDVSTILLPPDQIEPPQPDPMQQMQVAQLQAQINLLNAQAKAAASLPETQAAKVQVAQAKAQNDASIREQQLHHDMVMDAAEMALAQKADPATAKTIISPG